MIKCILLNNNLHKIRVSYSMFILKPRSGEISVDQYALCYTISYKCVSVGVYKRNNIAPAERHKEYFHVITYTQKHWNTLE